MNEMEEDGDMFPPFKAAGDKNRRLLNYLIIPFGLSVSST